METVKKNSVVIDHVIDLEIPIAVKPQKVKPFVSAQF